MKSIEIDFLKYQKNLTLKTVDNKTTVFDPIRKDYFILQPEELVRQLCLQYLIVEKKYSKLLIKVEKEINYGTHVRRYDILTMTNKNKPYLLVECKAPNIPLNQSVLDQISQYNLKLNVPYLLVTNGRKNYCFSLNMSKDAYVFIEGVPNFIRE